MSCKDSYQLSPSWNEKKDINMGTYTIKVRRWKCICQTIIAENLNKCEFEEKSIQPGSDRTTVRVGSPAYYKFHAWVEMNAKGMENKSPMLSTSDMAKAREGIIGQWDLHQELRAKDMLSDAQIQKWDKTGNKMKRLGAIAQAEEKSSGMSVQAASKSKTCSSNAKYCADLAEPDGFHVMNVAIERPATQSATSNWRRDDGGGDSGDAKKAVDGDPNSAELFNSCAITKKQRNQQSWWRVDVGAKKKCTECRCTYHRAPSFRYTSEILRIGQRISVVELKVLEKL